jgi:acyl-CoA synthetase (AMP-forming)/AMP-acid ligase II
MRGDLEWGTIPNMVAASASRFADQEAVVDGDVRMSFRELGTRVDEVTRAMIAAGVSHGERVAIWAPNIHQWILAALGALGAGAAVVPLNTRYKGHEASYILNKSRASTLCTVNGFLDTDYVALLADAGVDLPHLQRTIVMSGDAAPGTLDWDSFIEGGDAVTDAELQDRRDSIRPDDLSDILFTAGTTGKPKGAMVTHAQTLRQFADWSDIIGLRSGDRYLIVNPFFHVFGYKAGFVSALMRGATVIPKAVFDLDDVLATIEREQVSMFPGPPTIHISVLNHPDRGRFDLSSLRLCATGATTVPEEMIRRMREELTYETIVTGYGLTECTGTATMSRHDDPIEKIARTSGRPIPDVEVEIVDDNMNELDRGMQGEIVVRGYNVMLGYFDEAEQTATAIAEDGWLHTGDLGVMDEDGYVSITGRKKDMFIVGGFNTYPAEIEDSLLSHEALAEVAVVGVPDERLGEVGMAWIVLRPGAELDPEQLIEWSRERLANYKVPRYLQIVEGLPTNPAGKVLKHELAARGADLLENGTLGGAG